MSWLRSLVLGACLLQWACEPDMHPATAVVVSVMTDLVGDELREVVYRVFPRNADPYRDAPLYEVTSPVELLDQPFVVVRGEADSFLISVEGFAAPGAEPVVSYQARATFEQGKTRALRVFLARSCYLRDCVFSGLSCYGETYGATPGGTCGPIPTPALHEVRWAGEENEWTPMPAPF